MSEIREILEKELGIRLVVQMGDSKVAIYKPGVRRAIRRWKINPDVYADSGRERMLGIADGLVKIMQSADDHEITRFEANERIGHVGRKLLEFCLVGFDYDKTKAIGNEHTGPMLFQLSSDLFEAISKKWEDGWVNMLINATSHGKLGPLMLIPDLNQMWIISNRCARDMGTISELHREVFDREPTEEEIDLYDTSICAWLLLWMDKVEAGEST